LRVSPQRSSAVSMFTYEQPRQPWKNLPSSGEQLLHSAAHDARTARILEQAGFKAQRVLIDGRRMTQAQSADLEEFGGIVGMEYWKEIEHRFQSKEGAVTPLLYKVSG